MYSAFLTLFICLKSMADPLIIYGTDDRKEAYEIKNSQVRQLSRSTVAVVSVDKLIKKNNGDYSYKVNSIEDEYGLCSGLRYGKQLNVADCSGFLISKNLVVTAGHCIDEISCNQFAFIFDYTHFSKSSKLSGAAKKDVFQCKKIVKRELSRTVDYAIVELDRDVINRKALKLRAKGQVAIGTPIIVIGHPLGAPTKFADGASVLSVEKDYFRTNADSFGSNSGSAVINESTLEVEGILVRGDMDFVYDSKKQCRQVNICPMKGCGGFMKGEEATFVKLLL